MSQAEDFMAMFNYNEDIEMALEASNLIEEAIAPVPEIVTWEFSDGSKIRRIDNDEVTWEHSGGGTQ